MPAIAKILIIFAAMLGLSRVGLQLGAALVLGGLALNIWSGLAVPATLVNLFHALTSGELWLFLVITSMIIEVGHYMTDGENAKEIVAAARRWGGRHGSASALMSLPAVIGLVPMPGGALFSAPFVEQAGESIPGAVDWKTAVNYWFRHVWEYWWPLYPGVIVAMSVFEMPPWKFIAAEFLYTPVAIGAGYVFLVRPHVGRLLGTPAVGGGSSRRALVLMLPIGAVVVALFAVPALLAWAWPTLGLQMRKLLSMFIGLLVSLGLILYDKRAVRRRGAAVEASVEAPSRLFSTLLAPRSLSVMMTLAGVLVFKHLLESSGLLPDASRELLGSGIPVSVAVAMLPFLAGFVTGLALGFAGTAFPLVVGLMSAAGSGMTPMATLVLAFGFGYTGMMLSPVHLCLLVTRDYFSSSLWNTYRHVLPCAATVMVFSLLAHVVFAALGW